MIKAIIFDCFGVLVTGSLQKFIDTYVHDNESRKRIYELNDQANAGYLSYEDMLQQYADVANVLLEETKKVMNSNPKNTILIDYITSSLKANYKIGFLSNAADNWLDRLLGEVDARLFDDVVLSCDINIVKPDAQIYELAASRLGVEASECVFVDDIERYCTGAENVGMKSIHYTSFSQMKDELEQLLADSDK